MNNNITTDNHSFILSKFLLWFNQRNKRVFVTNKTILQLIIDVLYCNDCWALISEIQVLFQISMDWSVWSVTSDLHSNEYPTPKNRIQDITHWHYQLKMSICLLAFSGLGQSCGTNQTVVFIFCHHPSQV